jgi:outer membrane receptor protein involved in Fe transport
LVDVDSFEVLRGPQTTYFGNNTIGGAFSVTSRKPGREWEGQVSQSYEFDAQESVTELAAGGPLTDTLGLRVAGHFSNMAGWLDNVSTGERNPGDTDNFGRATLVWQAAQDWEVTLKAEKGDDTQRAPLPTELTNCPPAGFPAGSWENVGPPGSPTACARALAGGYVTSLGTNRTSLPDEKGYNNSSDVLLNIERAGKDGPGFVALLARTEYDLLQQGDVGSIPVPYFQYSTFEKYYQTSLELRLTSPDSLKLKWMVGAYGMRDNLTFASDPVFSFLSPVVNFLEIPAVGELPPGVLSAYEPLALRLGLDQRETAYSGFGVVTYPFTDQLSGTVGGRWTHSDKDGAQAAYVGTATDPYGYTVTPIPPGAAQAIAQGFIGYDNHSLAQSLAGQAFMPSGNLQYKLTDDVSTYASATKGWKAGGFDATNPSGDPSRLVYQPETVVTYELGVKSLWFNHSLLLNMDVFDSKNKNLQQSEIVAVAGTTFTRTTNVGDLSSHGIEFDSDWRIDEIWRAGINFAYLHARYDNYLNATCTQIQLLHTPVGCSQNLTGVAPPFAPNYSGSARLGFVVPTGVSLKVSGDAIVSFSDKYDLTGVNDPAGLQAAWHKVDLRLGLGDGSRWEVAALVKNIANVQVAGAATGAPGSAGVYTEVLERGRQVAVQGRYNW